MRSFLHKNAQREKSVSLTFSNPIMHTINHRRAENVWSGEEMLTLAFKLSEVSGESEEWLHFYFPFPRAIIRYTLFHSRTISSSLHTSRTESFRNFTSSSTLLILRTFRCITQTRILLKHVFIFILFCGQTTRWINEENCTEFSPCGTLFPL